MRRQQQLRRARRSRDESLRHAHQRAFEQIREATQSARGERMISQAVEELIDACEAYVTESDQRVRAAAS